MLHILDKKNESALTNALKNNVYHDMFRKTGDINCLNIQIDSDD